MQISNNFSVTGLDATRSANRSNASNAPGASTEASGIQQPADQLELSPEALSMSEVGPTETFRADRVAELRQAIAQGGYDTDERLEAALSKMLDQLG